MNKKSYIREKKVSGGKLIRINCETEKEVIRSIRITGDFFIHPENGIDLLERALIGLAVDVEIISEKVNKTLIENSIEIVGFTNSDLAELVAGSDR